MSADLGAVRWGRALPPIGRTGLQLELFGAETEVPCRFALVDPLERDLHSVCKFAGAGPMEPKIGLTDEHALQMVEERLLADLADRPLCELTVTALDGVRTAMRALLARGRWGD